MFGRPAEQQRRPAGAPARQLMRASETMPTLHKYTRADVQEQYLAPASKQVRQERRSESARQQQQPTGELGAGSARPRRKRAKSGGARAASNSPSSNSASPCSSNSERSPTSRTAHLRSQNFADNHQRQPQDNEPDSEQRKRRRSQSASRLFTACFNIPHLLPGGGGGGGHSDLADSTGAGSGPGSSTRRSILAHLGIGSQQQQQQQHRADSMGQNQRNRHKQRPISASKTALEPLSQLADERAPGGRMEANASAASTLEADQRKHVSFEARNRQSASAAAAAAAHQQLGANKENSTTDNNNTARPGNFQRTRTGECCLPDRSAAWVPFAFFSLSGANAGRLIIVKAQSSHY